MAKNKLQSVRGTKDLFAEEYLQYLSIENKIRQIALLYGCKDIATPIFEFTEVFKRTLGDTSDVVNKEMYSFDDRGGENITLRPEFTASVVRALISGGMQQLLPLKLFSSGPLFRYERPQKGRQRQFHQVNVEYIGYDSPLADSEIIAMAAHILENLGILDKCILHINSLGDVESRANYRNILTEYFSDFVNELSDDSKMRLSKNPLRILDSKDEGDKKINANAPKITESLNSFSQDFFGQVLANLGHYGIKYEYDTKLVRGLDYYTHTCFEFITDHLGSQGTVLGGGRYDGLVKMMGGEETPSVGFAAGIERLMMLVENNNHYPRPIVLIPIGDNAEKQSYILAQILRKSNIHIEIDFKGNLAKRMKKANKYNAKAVVIFGDDEISQNIFKVRHFDLGSESNISSNKLLDFLQTL
jgi:histidyl-tRNA synthetase